MARLTDPFNETEKERNWVLMLFQDCDPSTLLNIASVDQWAIQQHDDICTHPPIFIRASCFYKNSYRSAFREADCSETHFSM